MSGTLIGRLPPAVQPTVVKIQGSGRHLQHMCGRRRKSRQIRTNSHSCGPVILVPDDLPVSMLRSFQPHDTKFTTNLNTNASMTATFSTRAEVETFYPRRQAGKNQVPGPLREAYGRNTRLILSRCLQFVYTFMLHFRADPRPEIRRSIGVCRANRGKFAHGTSHTE